MSNGDPWLTPSGRRSLEVGRYGRGTDVTLRLRVISDEGWLHSTHEHALELCRPVVARYYRPGEPVSATDRSRLEFGR